MEKPFPLPNVPTELPVSDACSGTITRYKNYVSQHLDNFYHAQYDREFSAKLTAWSSCCPELREKVNGIRLPPERQHPNSKTELPRTVWGSQGTCEQHAFFQPSPRAGSPAHAWQLKEEQRAQVVWIKRYFDLGLELQSCCVRHLLSECLENAPGFLSGDSLLTCSKRWSPYLQAGVDLPGPAPQVAQQTPTEKATCAAITKDHAALTKEHDDCQLALYQVRGEQQKLIEQRQNLEATLKAAAPPTGIKALAEFPAGAQSLELAWWACVVIFFGFLLGLPGLPGRRRQILSGAVAAILSGILFGGVVALLPDTRFPILPLAAGVTLLPISLRTLARAYVLVGRTRAVTPPSP